MTAGELAHEACRPARGGWAIGKAALWNVDLQTQPQSSLHEHVKRLAGARALPGRVTERNEGEDNHAGADGRLAVMALERAVGGAPCDQRTGHTRRGLHRMGTPNRKPHPLLVDCHTMIDESHSSSPLDHF